MPMFKGITKMAVQVDSTARLPEYMAMALPQGAYRAAWAGLSRSAIRRAAGRGGGRTRSAGPAQLLHRRGLWATQTRSSALPSSYARAERPMIIVGKGVRWSEPTLELRQLVETPGHAFPDLPHGAWLHSR